MAKRKAEDGLERPKEPPTFEEVKSKSRLLAALMDTETKNNREEEPPVDDWDKLGILMFGPPEVYEGNITKQAEVKEQQIRVGLQAFTKAVRIVKPRTGNARFVQSDGKERTLADEQMELPTGFKFHLDEDEYQEINGDGLNVQDGLAFLQTYYRNEIAEYKQDRVWIISEEYAKDLRRLLNISDSYDYHQTHTMMIMFMGYATGNREFIGPDHFWLLLYDSLVDIAEDLNELSSEDFVWTAERVIESFSSTYKRNFRSRAPGVSFMEYMNRWLLENPDSPMHIQEFMTNIRERVLAPLITRAELYFMTSHSDVRKLGLPVQARLPIQDVDHKQNLLPLIKFFLAPSKVTFEAVGNLPDSMNTNASLKYDVLFSTHERFILDMFRVAHSNDKKDWIPLQFDANILARLVRNALTGPWLFDRHDDDIIFFREDAINALLLYMLLAHPDWCKNGQVAFVGQRKESDDAEFNRLMDARYIWEDDWEAIVIPDGTEVFPLDFKNLDTNLKTNQRFYEWLVKKHPSYRRKQVDAYLFETPLGMVRPNLVLQSPVNGMNYVGKGQRATFQVVPKKGRPLGDKFALTREIKEDVTGDGSKKSKRSIPIPKELPADVYQLISEFHIKGKVIDQAWCERNDQDTDIREYLFRGYWRLLHYASFQALLASDIAFAKRLVQFVADVLPCDNCREHFNEQLEAAEVPLASMTGPQLQQFLVQAHNQVNKENGKPVLSLSQAQTESARASNADFPGFWDLLHRRAARVKFSWDRADLIQLARLITELTLSLHPTWYGKLASELGKVQDVQDMFEMTVKIHNKINKSACRMELEHARLVYS